MGGVGVVGVWWCGGGGGGEGGGEGGGVGGGGEGGEKRSAGSRVTREGKQHPRVFKI